MLVLDSGIAAGGDGASADSQEQDKSRTTDMIDNHEQPFGLIPVRCYEAMFRPNSLWRRNFSILAEVSRAGESFKNERFVKRRVMPRSLRKPPP